MLGLRMSRNIRQTQPKIVRMLSAWGTGKPLVKQERANIQLDGLRQTKPDDREPIQLTDYGINLDGRDVLHVETRNMCRCEACFGKHAHQRKDLPYRGNAFPGVRVEEIGRISDHYVSLKWSDGHEGLVARTMRGDFGPGVIESRLKKWLDLTRRKNAEQHFWKTPDGEVTKFWNYSWVVENGENTRQFLAHYMKYGIALMNEVPAHLGMEDIVSDGLQIGPFRRTCYDIVDYVRFRPNPVNSGYGSERLPLHLDLAYYYEVSKIVFINDSANFRSVAPF